MAKGKQSAPAKSAPAPAPSRGASPAAVQAFVASNPNSRTAQAAAPRVAAPAPAPRVAAPVQTNAGPNPMGAPAKAQTPTVMQGLKIAGAGGITKKELEAITEASGKSGAQVIQRLDDLNRNLREKDQLGINLNAGAANMLIKEASKAAPSYDNFLGLGQSAFGTGKIGSTLQDMVGSRSTGGYINPVSGQQSMTPAVAPTFMIGGTAIKPGGRQTVQGFGKQFGMPTSPTTTPGTAMPSNLPPTSGDNTGPMAPDLLPELLPEEEKQMDININMPGSPLDLSSWATGFKTARSSRKRAGRGAQGLASQRVSPIGTFRGGV